MVVHAPLALLLVGTGMRLLGLLRTRFSRLGVLVPSGRLVLVLGTAGAWAAVYTGTLADAEVARTLCDPTVAEQHEQWAYRVAWLFSAGLLVDGVLWTEWLRNRIPSFVLPLLLAGCLVGGSIGLGYVGHLGATLVYQQGAAVYHPAPNCAAFE